MRIDAHQHFWTVARGDYGWLTPELKPLYRDFGPSDLEPLLTRHGIEATILVQAAETVAETGFMLKIAAATPFVRGVVGWVDFGCPDAPAVMERLAGDARLKGLRPMIQDIPDPAWMLEPSLAPVIAAIERLGLRFDALLKPIHLPPFREFIRRYPNLPIVIDHGAKPEILAGRHDEWAEAMGEIARDERIHCKLTGLVTEASPSWQMGDLRPYVDHLIECFGPRRLMWGSDWPVVNLAGGYDRWMAAAQACLAALSADEQEQIFGRTAARFYGI